MASESPAKTDQSEQTICTILNLRKLVPSAPPPRPHTSDFSTIIFVLNDYRSSIHKFDGGSEVRIGRHVGGKIRWNNFDLSIYDVDQRSVSRRHCRVFLKAENGLYYIEDLGSRNGTWLNGLRLEPRMPRPITSRDYIQVGQPGFWIFLPKTASR